MNDMPQINFEESLVQIKPDEKPIKRFRFWKFHRPGKRILIGLSLAFVVLFVLILFPALRVYRSGMVLAESARRAKDSVNSQDITVVRGELNNFKGDLESFQGAYRWFGWVQYIPWAGRYWKDGNAGIKAGLHGLAAADKVIETLSPYADIIGFAGPESDTAQSGEDTANDRIEFLVQSVEQITPQIDGISAEAQAAVAELSKIDPNRYPKEFRGIPVREKLKNGINLAIVGAGFVSKSKPLMEAAPYMLGMDEERTYLVLFQNDKELRPTGGFITAYSIMTVKNGKVSQVNSSDIYHLDNAYRPVVPAPDPIINYIKGVYAALDKFRLRDMNWSPDFRESMDLFMNEAEKAGIEDIDGVIAVDTHVVVNLLKAIGQIGVPGFGNFSAENDERCNCPQVVYELESFADVEGPVVWSENEPEKIVFAPPNYDNRKKIVGPLMNSLLGNALGQPKEKLPDLFEAAWDSINEKHVLIYMFDENAQKGVESFEIAGRIKDIEGDYLHINDANLGGRKSNMYVTQEVSQDVDIARDGTVTKTLSITYKNPQDYDGWLNSVLPNWTRIYVPRGSELVSVDGFDDEGETYEELGKTVFSGGFELRPQGIKQIIIVYKLPFKVSDDYWVYLQKQPGTDMPLYVVNVGGKTEELFLKTDQHLKFSI
ncbi:MAG: hypothetical protein UV74_C0013G0293 [Candidatus Woesebacteria bacterium GW2011_GWB1_43_14]|uniref:DUF4012 domain-containing protein n=1 Tax=Candidatus Woesebacteria bacterium GW2011_GWB1_43_14 TaxID=1618578 RepID=A0A0G1FQ72_9BACT|nr:MAG: hypothetical protein UT21_C0001G0003 [Candidatus Woesebacteria bacterium GW2011_GWA1_39_11b]KKS78412.1 MAG: hypothetical protein UV51_C0001G0128 [Candidatus Woesebacteria bacterium GW2011_GWC1_42_9]KKS97171.1 MAG: hypothetical protein UV74_C0013G0293 [Candidatus Woesebacteria bacterium GW2011_GWB1_43_14]